MKGWKITWDELEWTDDKVTAAQAVAVAGELPGSGWGALSPWTGPVELAAWLTVLIAGARGCSLADAMAEVWARPAADLIGCLSERE